VPRFLILGNGQIAATAIDAVAKTEGAELIAFATSESGTPVARRATELGAIVTSEALVLAPDRLHDLLSDRGGETWLVSANSTTIVPAASLAPFGERALNLHPGLLPQYAGLHTHQWAIRNGETEFGVTVHTMTASVDAGEIVAEARLPIRERDTGLSLFMRCVSAGRGLLRQVVESICAGEPLTRVAQDPTQRRLYRARDAAAPEIDWEWTARQIVDFVRAGDYRPFRSPTYVARVPGKVSTAPEVLRARAVEMPAAATEPGALIRLDDCLPVVACRAGAVELSDAALDGSPVSEASWRAYFEGR